MTNVSGEENAGETLLGRRRMWGLTKENKMDICNLCS